MTSFCIASSSVSHSLIETGILWSLSLTKKPESMAGSSERGRAGQRGLWRRFRALLDDENAVVEVQRVGCPGEFVGRQNRVIARVPAVEPVDQRLAVFEKGSFAAMPAAEFHDDRRAAPESGEVPVVDVEVVVPLVYQAPRIVEEVLGERIFAGQLRFRSRRCPLSRRQLTQQIREEPAQHSTRIP